MAVCESFITCISGTVNSINALSTLPLKYYFYVDNSCGRSFYKLYAVPFSHESVCSLDDSHFFDDQKIFSKYLVKDTHSQTTISSYVQCIFQQALQLSKF